MGNPPEHGVGEARPQPDLQGEVARLEDRWRRAVADLDNARKRFARELELQRSVERSRAAGAWLSVVDNLERALSHADNDSDPVVAGVRNTLAQAVELLAQLGYPRDTETGVPFDPARHEVVSVVDRPDTAPGTVVEVLRPGYGTGSQQLRPAAVVVSRREGDVNGG